MSLHSFIDPRVTRGPTAERPSDRTTARAEELAELHALCRAGRLYDVERWIKAGRPLQGSAEPSKRRLTSALEIALRTGNHAIVLLLLSNGYQPNQEFNCPLDIALRVRRFDLLHLLLEWGADPHRVDLSDLFDAYDSDLYARFLDLGVDLTAGHALAAALAYHTSNKPLFGFAKRHRTTDPRIQRELDIALAHHAAEGNEKGVQLSLWAGADPHVPVPSLRYSVSSSANDGDTDDAERFEGFSAVYEACQRGNDGILERLRLDPARDDMEELWRSAGSAAVIQLLARHALPTNVGAVIQRHLWWAAFNDGWQSVETLKRLFEVGVRWQRCPPEDISTLRRSLLKASDSTFVDLIKLLAAEDYCSTDVLQELARTPSMRARMQKVGFIPSSDERTRFNQLRPTRSREVLRRFGVEIPQPKHTKLPSPPLPPSVRIGPKHPSGETIRLDRAELFERVWSKPVATIAKEVGISGPGLKKVCQRLQIPVPQRGYWAKLKAGKSVRRPALPALPAKKAEETSV